MTFDDFNFHESLADSLYYMNFRQATPVQELAIPKILDGIDLLATAQTGTGKTAAFMLPILNKLAENPRRGIDTLVVVPTRELAQQIDQQIQGFSYYINASSIALYGGGDGGEFVDQRRAIENGVNIIVATPGKLISHLNMGYVNLKQLQHFVLDEADRMLDMGFLDDIKKIITFLPEKRQNLLFSATMPPDIHKLSKQMLKNAFEIKIAISKPAEGVKQIKYEVTEEQKAPLLAHIIHSRPEYDSILIFSSTKKKISQIEGLLRRKKIQAAIISSDLDQREREQVLMSFKAKLTKILIATDVLSRGIDIKNINLVVNFDVPADAEDYVHRIGRTARAETKGEAITLVNKEDSYKMIRIERLIEMQVEKVSLPMEIGDSPDLRIKDQRSKKPYYKKGRNNQKPSNSRPNNSEKRG